MSKYKQLTKEERCQIAALLKRGIAQSQIAIDLGVDRSTIYREIKRNRSKSGYYKVASAQEFCNIRKERFCYHRKFTPAMEKFIIEKLVKEQWSPEQIKG